MTNHIGHVVAGFFSLLIVVGVIAALTDGRSLITNDSHQHDDFLVRHTGTGSYGMGVGKDTNGRVWHNEHHFTQILGCGTHRRLGQNTFGFSVISLVFAFFTVVLTLLGARTGKGLWGTIAVVTSAALAVFLIINVALSAAFYNESYQCYRPGCKPQTTPTPAQNISCHEHACIATSGFFNKQNKTTIECDAGSCTDAQCCDIFCNGYTCEAGYDAKLDVATIACNSETGCTRDVCCDQVSCPSVAANCPVGKNTTTALCGNTAAGNAHMLATCDIATCCTVDYCSGHTCTGMDLELRNDAADVKCATAGCADALCCSNLKCPRNGLAPQCHSGLRPPLQNKVDREKIVCPPGGCSTAVCCDPIVVCSSFTCVNNGTTALKQKANHKEIECGLGGCTADLCCEPNPDVFCNTYDCPARWFDKPGKSSILCGKSESDCQADKCCDWTICDGDTIPLREQGDSQDYFKFKRVFKLGYALPIFVVAFVLAVANVASLIMTGCMQDAFEEIEEDPSVYGSVDAVTQTSGGDMEERKAQKPE